MIWIRWSVIVGVIQALLWAIPATVPAERKDSYADKIEQEKKTLEKLRGTIVEKRKKADEAEKKRESVLQGLQSLDERLVRYRQEHQDIRKKLKKKDLEIEHKATGHSPLILPSQIIPIEVECIRNMLHGLGRHDIILYQDDIEAARTISNTMLCKILRGQLNQFGALTRIDRLDRTSECPRSPPFDFDEYQDSLIIGDEIELAQR